MMRAGEQARHFFRLLRHGRLLGVTPACLVLAACGFSSSPTLPETPDPGPVGRHLIAAAPGDEATVDDAEFGAGVRIRAGDAFTSAAGENCRRGTVFAGRKDAEVVVACQGADGVWRMAPRIWGQGMRP